MPTNISLTLLDYDGEKSSFGYSVEDLASDGTNTNAILTGIAAMQTYIAGITRATIGQTQLSRINRLSNAQSSDPESAREEKWLVTYEDVTQWLDDPTNLIPNAGYGKKFNLEIPSADLSLRVGNSEIVYTPAMAAPPAAIGESH